MPTTPSPTSAHTLPAQGQVAGLVLDPYLSSPELTRQLCDVESVSGNEAALADAVEAAVRTASHLDVSRYGNTIVARTELGRERRVVIAGHLDTVPVHNNLPTRVDEAGVIWGRGTVDMKAGVAVQLKLAVDIAEPALDVNWVWYDNEEVESTKNGLGLLAASHPEMLRADFAILGEPTGGQIEGGCNGTLRVDVTTHGVRAHSARAWVGENAIHRAAPLLSALAAYQPATVSVEGLDYREGLNATRISGGVAGNVIPDECVVHVNYRFAPSRSGAEAIAHVRKVLEPFGDVTVVDLAEGAKPGLDSPLVQGFVRAVGGTPGPKYGWTDVARFAQLGIPALNYGPGEAALAHADDERIDPVDIERCEAGLRAWLQHD